MVNALIKFHELRIPECKRSLTREKRPILNQGTVNKKWKDNSNTNEQNAKEIAENTFKKFNEFRSMMNKMSNNSGKKYTCLLTEFNLHNKGVQGNNKLSRSASKKRIERKTSKTQAYKRAQLERNRGYVRNLSSQNITDHEINLLSKGLKFIPTPLTKEQHIRRQLLQDFEQFGRRMQSTQSLFQWTWQLYMYIPTFHRTMGLTLYAMHMILTTKINPRFQHGHLNEHSDSF